MARISTYAIDGTPVSSDKLIGTDTAGTVTKNYPLGDVADWLKSSGATAVLGQNNYLFQIALDPDEGRKLGSFSFENYGGDGTEFSAVTELKFSASSSTGQYVSDYLLSTVGQKVLISQLDAPNNFGIYALVSLTQSSLEPTFYDAVLAFVDGNGALQGGESYGLATYSALNEAGGGSWGSITGTITNQTDLVDYIDAEIAAIPAPATPTLQSVTDAGAITTNDITTGSITSNGNFLITGTGSTVQLRGSSVDFDIQTAAADNVARVATTTGGSARLELYNHISGFNGALEFRATSWENDALVISGGSPNATKFLVSRDPNAATLQVTGDSYFTGNVGIGTTSPTEKLELSSSGTTKIKIGSTNSFGRGIELYTTGAATFLDVEGNFSIRKYNDDPLWTAQAGTVIANQYFYGGYINFRQRGGATDLAQIGLENGSNTYFNTGNFGIGTTAPAHVLHINKDNPYIQIQDSSAPTRADMSAGIIMKDSTGAQSFGITQSNSVDVSIRANAGDLSLGTFSGTVIKLDGNNVGIGTTAPAAKLDVRGTISQRVDASVSANQYPLQFFNDYSGTDYYLLRQRVVNSGAQVRTGLGITGAPDAAFVLGPQTDQTIKFSTNGRISNLTDIIAADPLRINSGEVRIGDISGSAASYLNVIQGASSTKPALGLKQGVGGSNKMITILNSSGAETMGITSEGGFYFRDNNLVGRFAFEHDYSPAAADGLTIGIDLRTENASGAVESLGYIDVTQDDISADESSMRLSVGETTPTEVMRLQSDGNVGIGTTAPTDKLEVNTGGVNSKGIKIAYDSSNYVIFRKTTSTNFDIKSFIGGSEYGAIHFGNSVNIKTTNGSGGINFSRGTSTLMKINNSGNVGIGTTAPDSKLHIQGSFGNNTFKVKPNSDHTIIEAGQEFRIATTNSGDIKFQPGGVIGMFISGTSRNVGIGTTAPDSKLHVKATSGIAFKVDPNNADKEWYIDTTNPDHLKKEGNLILNADPTNVHASTKISFNIDGSNKASINSDGELGVGTTAQTSKVHVDGTAMRQLRMGTSGGPSSNTDTSGAIGDMAYDDNYFYIKTINGWGRVALDFGF